MTTSNDTPKPDLPWRTICTVLALCVFVPAGIPAAETVADGLIASTEHGWPQWRGPRRDGLSDEKGLLGEWPQDGPPLLWKFDGLGLGWSSPIIVGDRVYITGDVGGDLVLFALDHEGKVQWRAKNGAAWKGSYPGSRACCAYSEGRLYHLNAHGRLACFDSAGGAEIWAADILDRFDAENPTWAIAECLLVDGPRVIVTPGGKKALIAALDKQTGQTIWTTDPIQGEQTSYSSPILFAYAGRRLIANCSSQHGFGVDADTGQLLWTVPMTNRYLVNVATPIYGSGSVFYVTSYAEDGRLYCLKQDGQEIAAQHVWTAPIDTVTGSGVLVDGTLYAAGYQKAKQWFAIDWETGKTLYEHNDLTTGAAIYADGRLYIQDERGTVALLKPTPNGFQTTGKFQLTANRVSDAWAHPVLLNHRLYLRCYNVKP
ncbi:MAG: PQQ-binding-like beta-propeller repeat protein [Candidatus Hydrogenedentes bacterium]|nr:PQQ-binding-like beta-propeller repeat protein [Candidatus Hydrogenedentota bacterium]